MNDSIGLYLNDIGKVPLLTAEDERELSRLIEEGREAQEKLDAGKRSADLKAKVAKAAHAKDRFIRSNLRLVVSIARRYPLPQGCLLYTSPSPRDATLSRMPSSA